MLVHSRSEVWHCKQASDGETGGVVPAAGRRFAVAVTGDHSTPAVYGDHSHEPVPFAIAHVRHAVRRTLGFWSGSKLGLRSGSPS